jgi:lysyl endopeptidase
MSERFMSVQRRLAVLILIGGLFMTTAAPAGPPVIGPDAQDVDARVVELPMQVSTEGMTYDEYLARQQGLNTWLTSEMQAAAFDRPLRVELTQEQIDAVEQHHDLPLRIGAVSTLNPAVEITGDLAGQPMGDRGAFNAVAPGHYVWTYFISSPHAGAIRVHLENLSLPQNAALYLYSRAGEAFGPYTGQGPNGDGDLWTESVFGNEAILQLRVTAPVSDASLKQISFRITQVGSILARYTESFLRANFCGNVSCIVDASCYSGTPADPAKNAIAKMEWISGAFLYTCTGGLLNDTNPTQNNFFLTANHCLSKTATAKNVQFYWRFATSSCNGACPSNTNWPYKTTGSSVKVTNRKGDYTLLQLNSNPPSGSVFLGWTSAAIANTNGAALYRISNPNFGPQVYSQHNVSTSAPTCTGWPRGERIYSKDITGATDGGSSGSPVVNGSSQVVGQLSGACGTNPSDPCAAAANATVDGAFAYYFSAVKPYINP